MREWKHQRNRQKNNCYINKNEEEELVMKGYLVGNGYMGLVEGKYILFESESAYFEYMED